MPEFTWIIRFHRKDGAPCEEYEYNTAEGALYHFCTFYNDDSGLYSHIDMLRYNHTTQSEKRLHRIKFD